MKLLVLVLLILFVGVAVGKIVRKRDNSYGDELITPASTGEVNEGATEASEVSGTAAGAAEGSGAPSDAGGSSAPSNAEGSGAPSDAEVSGTTATEGSGSSSSGGTGAGKGAAAGYGGGESGAETPKEHAPVAIDQATQKTPDQQPSGYRK